MPASESRSHRMAVMSAALVLLVVAGVAALRWALLPWALAAALRAGGASDVTFAVERLTPWRLQLADFGFTFDATKVVAESVRLERSHWWSPSFGRLTVESARVDVDAVALGARTAEPPVPASSQPKIPLEEISIDGRVVVHAGEGLAETLALRFAARPAGGSALEGDITLTGSGVAVAAEVRYLPETTGLEFRTTTLRIDLGPAQKWIERWAPLAGGPWEMAGVLQGTALGSLRGGKFTAAGEFHLREGRLANPGLGLVAEGVEGEVDIADLTELLARRATLRAQTVTTGKIVATDLVTEFSRTESGRFDVAVFSARALGGTLHVEPFVYRPGDKGVEAVVLADGIRAEEVMALTQDLPARASGALSGRVPLRYDDAGLRFGTGWVGLKPGATAEIEFHAAGLLTGGTSPKGASYAVLKKVEEGILKLRVTELRLDIRPTGAPANRSAQLHVVGASVDSELKAPVTLDLNVNGPIESLINLGMKTGMTVGTKP